MLPDFSEPVGVVRGFGSTSERGFVKSPKISQSVYELSDSYKAIDLKC